MTAFLKTDPSPPLVESMTLLPNTATGAWIAAFKFSLESDYYEAYIMLGPLDLPVQDARMYLDTGKPLYNAREQFLQVVHLGSKH